MINGLGQRWSHSCSSTSSNKWLLKYVNWFRIWSNTGSNIAILLSNGFSAINNELGSELDFLPRENVYGSGKAAQMRPALSPRVARPSPIVVCLNILPCPLQSRPSSSFTFSATKNRDLPQTVNMRYCWWSRPLHTQSNSLTALRLAPSDPLDSRNMKCG